MAYCHQLTSVSFGDNISIIPTEALNNCDAIETIILGKNIVTLKMYSLTCKNIQNVYCHAVVPPTDLSSYTFHRIPLENVILYIPEQSVADYQKANVWKEFGTILPINSQGIDEVPNDHTTTSKVIRNGIGDSFNFFSNRQRK